MDKLQKITKTCRHFYSVKQYSKGISVSLRYFTTEKDDGSQNLSDIKTDGQDSQINKPQKIPNEQVKEQQIENKEHIKFSAVKVELEGALNQKLNEDLKKNEKLKIGKFAHSFNKQSKALDPQEKQDERKFYTFAKLLRESKFIDLGNPEGKIVSGKIFQTVGDDLYIDFGWKFYCVCPRPVRNGKYYVRGSIVRLKIKNLELSTRFIGSTTDITLSEADCTLLGLTSTPLRGVEIAAPTK